MTAELDREGPAAPPRRNGELAFAAPWERQLFGVTMALHERGVFAWGDFNAHLIDEIARWTAGAAAGDEYVYYEHWERALSRLLDERGVIDPAAVDARAREIAALAAGTRPPRPRPLERSRDAHRLHPPRPRRRRLGSELTDPAAVRQMCSNTPSSCMRSIASLRDETPSLR